MLLLISKKGSVFLPLYSTSIFLAPFLPMLNIIILDNKKIRLLIFIFIMPINYDLIVSSQNIGFLKSLALSRSNRSCISCFNSSCPPSIIVHILSKFLKLKYFPLYKVRFFTFKIHYSFIFLFLLELQNF